MSNPLQEGRDAHRRRDWDAAFTHLTRAAGSTPLEIADLERLAEAAYLRGRDHDYLDALDQLGRCHQEAGSVEAAARCAFWSGLKLMFRGETGPATARFARARRLVNGRDCVEQGYLRLAAFEERLAAHDHQGAHDAAAEAAALGERFGDRDLVACGRHLQGKALLLSGRIDDGVPLLDEAMLAVTAGELSPVVTGLIYCNVIDACQQVHALGRAREWTAALARWCDAQPNLIAFTTTCLIHRAEVLKLQGAWPDAIAEARRASAQHADSEGGKAPAAALYQEAEVHRLRGEFDAAERAYQLASRGGRDPQPGLALLRLAQGGAATAAAAMRRALASEPSPLARTRLLPAFVDILVETGAHEEAAKASAELGDIARRFCTPALTAMADEARGAIALAAGRPADALEPLAAAGAYWQQVDAPYLAARVRARTGLAARALGDEEGARLELDAARAEFSRLGAAPDVARIDSLLAPAPAHTLTPRELEVLRLVATGQTNKAIAARLRLSERTVERHLSNIFTKLDLPSRAAATAWAFRHGLV